jgi:hypothetical protein
VIENLKITIDHGEKHLVYLGNYFPDSFSLKLNHVENNFNLRFIKVSIFDHTYKNNTSNIYVIDKETGQPVQYKFGIDEVILIYI